MVDQEFARFDPGEIQNIVDDFQQPIGRPFYILQIIPLGFLQFRR